MSRRTNSRDRRGLPASHALAPVLTLGGAEVIGYAQLALFLTGKRTTREMAVVSKHGAGWDVSLRGWQPTDPMLRVTVDPDGTVVCD